MSADEELTHVGSPLLQRALADIEVTQLVSLSAMMPVPGVQGRLCSHLGLGLPAVAF